MTTYLRRPGHVATVAGLPDDDGNPSRFIALLPNGPMIVLAGTASVIWDEIGDTTEDALAGRVAEVLGGVRDVDIDADVRAFVDELVTGGYLERYDPADT